MNPTVDQCWHWHNSTNARIDSDIIFQVKQNIIDFTCDVRQYDISVLFDKNPRRTLMCAWQTYLVSSDLYYKAAESILSDGDFDRICKWMADNVTLETFDELRVHHNHLFDLSSLRAGTGFNIKCLVPLLDCVVSEFLKDAMGGVKI